MLGRIYHKQPLRDQPAFTRTALSYSQFELALLSLRAQAVAYYARTGRWPRLAPHDSEHVEVWPS